MELILSRKLKCWLLYAFFVQLSLRFGFSFDNTEPKTNDSIPLVNSFTDCLINVWNFGGLNVNFSTISQPVVMYHYLSFPGTWLLYPFEMSPYQTDKVSSWVLETNLTEIMTTGRMMVNNKTIWFTWERGFKYLEFPFKTSFRLSIKNTNCEANLFLHPPNKQHSPHMFSDEMLKNPFKSYFVVQHQKINWQFDYINTIPKYFFLLCDKVSGSICEHSHYKHQWITSALSHPLLQTKIEVVLIWESGHMMQIHCPYCNPCDPFEMMSIPFNHMNFKNSLSQSTKLLDKIYPQRIEIILPMLMPSYEKFFSFVKKSNKLGTERTAKNTAEIFKYC